MPIYLDGQEYQDETSFEALNHPDIPESLKAYFKMPPEGSEKAAGALKSEAGTPVAPEQNSSPEAFKGLDVDWSRMNQPTGQVEMTQMGDSPLQRQLDDFAIQASKPAPKTLSEGSEESIKTAIDIAMSFGAGTMAGVRSKVVDKSRLYLAQEAELQGFNADEVYKGTGFFRGADDRWRYEIDDSTASFKKAWAESKDSQQHAAKLGTIFDHPELYEAYPHLKDVTVRGNSNLVRPNSAAWDGEIIHLGSQVRADKSTLMHEIQHAIQDFEGFAKGGTPGKHGKDYKLDFDADIDKLRKPFLDLQSKEMRGEALSAMEQAQLDHLKHTFKRYSKYVSEAEKEARENYLKLAGESEAVNVENRLLLNEKERMQFTPMDTQPYHYKDQIVRDKPSSTTPYKSPDGDGFLSY